MDENNRSWIITVLVVALIWAIFFHKDTYEGQTAEDWYNSSEDYKNALDQANENIEEAKNSAWESYQDMGDALDQLETTD